MRCGTAVALAFALLAGTPSGCGRAPWYMGQPLGGSPFIAEPGQAPIPSRLRVEIAREQVTGHRVTELRALRTLERVATLRRNERQRLVSLLQGRAAEWQILRRLGPQDADLREIQRLRSNEDHAFALDAPAPSVGVCVAPCRWQDWVLGAHTVAWRLLAPGAPASIDSALGNQLASLLVEEDPTSPDALEMAAWLDGRSGHFDAAERKLTDLVYYASDRGTGLERAARVWQRLGQQRRACATWTRLASWRGNPEDPSWHAVLSCARSDPATGDAAAIRRYLLASVSAERRTALRAVLEAVDSR